MKEYLFCILLLFCLPAFGQTKGGTCCDDKGTLPEFEVMNYDVLSNTFLVSMSTNWEKEFHEKKHFKDLQEFAEALQFKTNTYELLGLFDSSLSLCPEELGVQKAMIQKMISSSDAKLLDQILSNKTHFKKYLDEKKASLGHRSTTELLTLYSKVAKERE